MVELGNARVLAPGRWRWLRALGWMLLLFVGMAGVFILANTLTLYLAASVTGGRASDLGRHPGWPQLFGMAVSLAVVVAAYLLAVRYGEARPRPKEWALASFLPDWSAGLAIGCVLMTVTVGTMAATGVATIHQAPVRAIVGALVDTLQSGVFEELLFRLVVFRLLWRGFGAWWALAGSALLFGGLHLLNPNATPFAAICIAFEAGIMLAAFYMVTGRIWTSIGVHMGWNFTQGWIFGAAVSGTSAFAGGPLVTAPRADVADWLDGGNFGPEASLPGLLICTAAGLWVLHRAWRTGAFNPDQQGKSYVGSTP